MLNTYIKNRGISKLLVHNNNQNQVNEINWDADYDGNTANISVDLNNNGRSNHYDIELDNNDLENILNMQSINMPLDKRLKSDFKKKQYKPYYAELIQNEPSLSSDVESFYQSSPIKELIKSPTINTHISSPLSNEEILVPLSLSNNNTFPFTLTKKKRHYKPRTHKTYKAYRHFKTASKKSSKKTKRKSSRKYKTHTI